jgi:hypothetical protein
VIDPKITDALGALDDDATQLSGSKDEAEAALNSLAGAQHRLDVAKADVASKSEKLNADKAALVQLINTTYVA